jgi:hypothetical protein
LQKSVKKTVRLLSFTFGTQDAVAGNVKKALAFRLTTLPFVGFFSHLLTKTNYLTLSMMTIMKTLN